MISLDASHHSQKSKSTSSPLSLASDNEESTLSFSDLLKGFGAKKDSKHIQNGSLVLAIDDKGIQIVDAKDTKKTSKSDDLLSLLKNNDKSAPRTDSIEIDPKVTEIITTTLSVKEIKQLIIEAKQYLKKQIMQSDEFKRSEIKELPKTLKGLASVATKYGIDISKITVEKISSNENKNAVKTDILDTKSVKKNESKDIRAHNLKESKITDDIADEDISRKIKTDEKQQIKLPKEILDQPIFKSKKQAELSTEQFVQVKEAKLEKPTQKSRADETLQMLLRGEKAQSITEKGATNLTADFSVATAKVIAPSAKSESTKTLESLLRVDNDETSSKLDGMNVNKADSFEVKLNEAKQMIKYLSQDVKNAIEDYKAPFTRIKVQLNPQQLGEVDLTVVQRGKNLIVNLSSNNAAINTLAMNANDLRTQLQNSGINNATLNFSNNSQSDQNNASQQQQHRQNEQKADKEYNYFDKEEQNEEIISSLEIVVPSYA